MQSQLKLRVGVAAFACVVTPSIFAQAAPDLLTGLPKLACEATLCLSSSVQPGECNPSLDHYFDIEVFKKGVLDWSATVRKRLQFLSMCPSADEPGMPERVDAISKGAGKCDAAYLNKTYASTSYKYKRKGYSYINGETIYEVQPIATVTLNKLPSYCVAYNNHEWTYELDIKYVGTPLHGGYWVNAKDFDREQAKWNATHASGWFEGWQFAMADPRNSTAEGNYGYSQY